jgi:hypothetical protein
MNSGIPFRKDLRNILIIIKVNDSRGENIKISLGEAIAVRS